MPGSSHISGNDPAALHLWKACYNSETERLHPEALAPEDIRHDIPSLIILDGMTVNHAWAEGGESAELNRIMGRQLGMLGGQKLAETIQTIAVTYPDTVTQRAEFDAATSNTLGNKDYPYSPLAMQLAKTLLGSLPDYDKMDEPAKTEAVRELQQRLRTKVITGFSLGTAIQEGLQNAMRDLLIQQGFPHDIVHDSIMPNLKMLASGDIAIQQRPAHAAPAGTTFVHAINHRDRLHLYRNTPDAPLSPLISGNPVLPEGKGSGTSLSIYDREAVLMVSVANNFEENDIFYRDDKGHHPNTYYKAGTPVADEQKQRLSYTELTGFMPGNILRGMVWDAKAATSDLHKLPDVMQLISTPHHALNYTNAPHTDPLYAAMAWRKQYNLLVSLMHVANPLPIQDTLAGNASDMTYLEQQKYNIIAQAPWEIRKNTEGEIFFTLTFGNIFVDMSPDHSSREFVTALNDTLSQQRRSVIAYSFSDDARSLIINVEDIQPDVLKKFEQIGHPFMLSEDSSTQMPVYILPLGHTQLISPPGEEVIIPLEAALRAASTPYTIDNSRISVNSNHMPADVVDGLIAKTFQEASRDDPELAPYVNKEKLPESETPAQDAKDRIWKYRKQHPVQAILHERQSEDTSLKSRGGHER